MLIGMDTFLNEIEARVLGCLVEKELTTPEYYPLTLNALVDACNQKTNRAPLMQLDGSAVVRGLEGLRERKLAWEVVSSAARVPKYTHNLRVGLELEPPQQAVLCELLVRGPQTLCELRTRASRMVHFADAETVQEVLRALADRPEALVVRLPREPGRREERYAHLLSGPVESETGGCLSPEPARLVVTVENERLAALEREVAALRAELAAIREELAGFKAQFL